MNAPIPRDEQERLQALEECQLLDTPPEDSYDRLVRVAARLFSTPISIVSLIAHDRQFFKSVVGFDFRETERNVAFCAHAILQPDPTLVLDARLDPRFQDNPLVTGTPGIRFYCGAPITTPDHHRIGSVCVIDTEPRVEVAPELVALLQDLAAQVSAEIAHRQESLRLERVSRALAEREAQLKREQELRRETEIRAELALEAGKMGYWAWEAASSESVFSPVMLRLFSYAATESTPRYFQWMKRMHPEDRTLLADLMRRADPRKDCISLKFRVVLPDGELRCLEVRGHYRRGSDGTLEGANGVCWDVTEKYRANERLRASEEVFRGISEASPVGIFRADLQGRVNYVNQRNLEIWGLSEAEILNSGWLSRVHPEDSPGVLEGWMRANSAGSTYEKEFRLLLDDRTVRWVHARSSILRDRDGAPIGTVGTLDDITSRKSVDEERHASQELTRKILESSADCIKVLDLEGRLLSMSPGGQRSLGITDLRPLLGLDYFRLWQVEKDQEAAKAAFRAASKGENGSFQGYFPNTQGELLWWDTIFSPIVDRNGAPERILAVSRDMTELRQASAEQEEARQIAEEANRAKSLFLANVSHELRTPLNGVLGMADILLGSGLTPHQMELAATVKQSGIALLVLVNDLLDLSRVEAGKLDCKRLPFDLRSTLQQALSLTAPEAQRKNLKLAIAYPESLPSFMVGDSDRVRQIVINYLHNAVKFTQTGGISVKVRLEGEASESPQVLIEVHDTGKGIPEEAQAHLFKAFRQVDASSTREHGGIGLGLAISSRLAEAMGGSVGLTSRAGKGSVFWVRLPIILPATAIADQRRSGPEEPGPEEKAPGLAQQGNQPRVLLAEDNAINQKVALHFLKKLGCSPEVASDGTAAVRLFQQNTYDLVLMDCQMPVLDGYEAAQQIRQLEASRGQKRTPMIAVTAHAMVGDRERCLKAGMDDYLSKPLALESLKAMLAKWETTPSEAIPDAQKV